MLAQMQARLAQMQAAAGVAVEVPGAVEVAEEAVAEEVMEVPQPGAAAVAV
jgi:hypothetical protein